MMRTIARVVLLLPVAFLIATVVTGFVIVSLGQERIVQAMTGRGPDNLPIGAAADLLSLAWSLLSVQTLVPALLVVVGGEVARIRGAMYYVIGGGIALAAIPLLSRIGHPAAVLDLSPAVWQVLATAGFSGGFVYWLLAGRTA